MGNYAVPESIRAYRPKGTIIKKIAGHFYVYEYSKEKTIDGKWRNKSGRLIGSIVEGQGYIPNSNLLCDAEISTVEFGDYAGYGFKKGQQRDNMEMSSLRSDMALQDSRQDRRTWMPCVLRRATCEGYK